MTKKFNQYLGKAGQLNVMSEFLTRGWNVAIPEVDIGDDIFVVQDENGTLKRIQVKTSAASKRTRGFSGQFSVSLKNLRNISNILVHYVFLVRHNEQWFSPVIIRQDFLLEYFEKYNVGSESGGNITFYFSYNDNTQIECSGYDFTKYIRDFTDFPKVEH